ncbi:MAG: UDP-N-acetylmuramoyl-L-alanine--D-glutamate ligase [bacterium]
MIPHYKQQFKGKRITIMGLGVLGRGVGYTKFLAECGAELTVTDLKTSEQLATSLKQLAKFKNIKYTLGEHKLEDFKDKDMIIKAAGVPLGSIYIAEAKKNGIPVEMDVSLFAKCAPSVTLVGVTGTRGKSMTTALIYEILTAYKSKLKCEVYLGGNVRGIATLPLLVKAKEGDILVCELDSWQLQGFGEAGISPHISVFTTFMPDHMNYYGGSMDKYFDDKANIFKYQKSDDTLVVLPEVKKMLPKDIKSKVVVAKSLDVASFKFIVPGEHQRANLACAVEAAKAVGVLEAVIKKAVAKFKGVEGRLQYLKTVKGVKIYNDNNATTPEATIACLKALSCVRQDLAQQSKNIILIAGGADKGLELKNLAKAIDQYCKFAILLTGSGTENLIGQKMKIGNFIVSSIKDAVGQALQMAKRGDTIVLSPAFASFGMFQNEYDRNDQFMKIIKKLK